MRCRNAPVAVRAGPGPGLGAGLVIPRQEDVAVLRVVLGVDVGLVQVRKGSSPFMIGWSGATTVVSNSPVPCF